MQASVTNLVPNRREAMEHAVVLGVADGVCSLRGSAGAYTAGRAFSCLVEPRPEDRVLVAWDGRASYVLAVLERPGAQDATLAFPADVRLEAKAGRVDIAAQAGLGLSSAGETQLAAPALTVTAAEGRVHVGDLSASGDRWLARLGSGHFIADALDSVVERLSQRFKNAFRFVEGVEQANVGDSLQTVRRTLSVRAQDGVITARKDLKIDAERIHMG